MTRDRVPWFGRHVKNLGDVIIYPVLVVARNNNEVTVRWGFTVFISLHSFDTSSDNVS